MQKLKGMERGVALSFEPFAAVKIMAFNDNARRKRSNHGGTVAREDGGGKVDFVEAAANLKSSAFGPVEGACFGREG